MNTYIEKLKSAYFEIKYEIKNSIKYSRKYPTDLGITIFIIFIQILDKFNDGKYDTFFMNFIMAFAFVIFIDFWIFIVLYLIFVFYINKITLTKTYDNEIGYDNYKKIYIKIENELKGKKEELIYQLILIFFNFLNFIYFIINTYK